MVIVGCKESPILKFVEKVVRCKFFKSTKGIPGVEEGTMHLV
jgi:hypothetical protein